jgi:hypothetical protein
VAADFDRRVTSGLGEPSVTRKPSAMASSRGARESGHHGAGGGARTLSAAPGRRILEATDRAAPSPGGFIAAQVSAAGEGGECCEHSPHLGAGKLFATTYLGDEHERA